MISIPEKEALDKWCPFARYLAVFRNDDGKQECAGSYNRGAQDSALTKCITTRCMSWTPTGNGDRGFCALMAK